ncbi:MAG: hypothetical protein R2939_15925 [Kofleriaceae bacterium]
MSRPRVELRLGSAAERARHRRDLASSGLFVPAVSLEMNTECDLAVCDGAAEVVVVAEVVWVAPGGGVGLQLRGIDDAVRAALEALLATEAGAAPATPADDEVAAPDDDDGDDEADARPGQAPTLHQRLRGLSVVEQAKVARDGELRERVALERIYGKSVWEPLLRNPRLSHPEVARLARMGTLPRPLLETIVGNGGWLSSPEVRRALLANPRLGTDLAPRVLRLLPKHELKLAVTQTAYPAPVRDLARRLLRGVDGG